MERYKPAEPIEEWDDQNRLYGLKYNLNYSAGHPGSVTRQALVLGYNVIVADRLSSSDTMTCAISTRSTRL